MPSTAPSTIDLGEEPLVVIWAVLGEVVDRRRLAGRGDQFLERRLVVELIEPLGRRRQPVGDERLDDAVGNGRAAVEVHGADQRLQRVGEDRRFLRTPGR